MIEAQTMQHGEDFAGEWLTPKLQLPGRGTVNRIGGLLFPQLTTRNPLVKA